MKNVYLVIDMQNDFLSMALGSKECQSAVSPICQILKKNVKENDIVIFTKDTHGNNYSETLEGRNIPPHCIKGTIGQEYPKEIKELFSEMEKRCAVLEIEKPTFGSIELANYLFDNQDEIEKIYVMGVCTTICVHANAVLARSACPDAEVILLENACKDSNLPLSKECLDSLKALQIQILKTI